MGGCPNAVVRFIKTGKIQNEEEDEDGGDTAKL